MAPTTFFELPPMDHVVAKVYTSYILHFDTKDTGASLKIIQNGVDRLTSHVPFLSGDVILSKAPETPVNRARVVPSRLTPEQVRMLHIKHHQHDQVTGRGLFPLPMFIPPSQEAPLLRFQANVFKDRITLVMSFHHHAFDGTGAERILEALAECCRAPDDHTELSLPSTIAANEARLRNEISEWPSKCVTRKDHSNEFGPALYDVNITSEQWAQIEATMAAAVTTKKFAFCSEKIRQVKGLCQKILGTSTIISSNDLVTAMLALCIDRAQNPNRDKAGRQEDDASVLMIVNMRPRVHPPIPSTYLGNLILPVRTAIYPSNPHPIECAGDQADQNVVTLAQLATEIRTKLQSMNETDAYSMSAKIAEQDNWNDLGGKNASAIFTSWRHLGVFEVDFGGQLGPIKDFETEPGLMPGGCIMLPAPPNLEDKTPATWNVDITMKPEDFERFEKDELLARIRKN